jgi:hypothetical protein
MSFRRAAPQNRTRLGPKGRRKREIVRAQVCNSHGKLYARKKLGTAGSGLMMVTIIQKRFPITLVAGTKHPVSHQYVRYRARACAHKHDGDEVRQIVSPMGRS